MIEKSVENQPLAASVQDSDSTSREVPFALQIAASWSWRLIVVAVVAWGLSKMLGSVSLIVVSVMVAALLAGLLSPVVFILRKYGVIPGLATAITEIGFIATIVGLLTLVGQQMISGFSNLADQAMKGYQQLIVLLQDLPINVGAAQFDKMASDGLNTLKDNADTIFTGVANVGSTASNFATGMAICLFTLIFFLMEGEKIWLFLVGLFPRAARRAVNGAGRRGWKSMVSYVRVQVFVAFVDAVGIGLAAFFLGVPLSFPLGVLVFLSSFIPVVGALASGAVAVLLALVANGPVNAIIMFGMVLLVQQVESNILQPLVMGKAVSLHPLAVIIAVAGGSILFGITGALFAVPLLAMINTVVRYLANREWEIDEEIRRSEFLYPHEIERKKKKAIAEKVKERMNRKRESDAEMTATEA
ncbi:MULTISPECIES: AI-2E family transporter [unclassified Rothia (in: high G+C Gram-positive bacteria)]|uniref:AI-2E family transporter n=1 Tax=unclassified Rothia (in: high G+C Gram-positive bacteria) TaxID=2689056 RepID=UPI0019585C4C|nr:MULTISPECIES: AI-2E family transporter [unclassified Rothia (in: high G+C Gram-positive bacteria)]MBM7051448.1 AI-2E family transporter [Rothia sp. ZJ1223]QRZ61239.1 AI-2E family transporter [Rothia sp. ZJ932]